MTHVCQIVYNFSFLQPQNMSCTFSHISYSLSHGLNHRKFCRVWKARLFFAQFCGIFKWKTNKSMCDAESTVESYQDFHVRRMNAEFVNVNLEFICRNNNVNFRFHCVVYPLFHMWENGHIFLTSFHFCIVTPTSLHTTVCKR